MPYPRSIKCKHVRIYGLFELDGVNPKIRYIGQTSKEVPIRWQEHQDLEVMTPRPTSRVGCWIRYRRFGHLRIIPDTLERIDVRLNPHVDLDALEAKYIREFDECGAELLNDRWGGTNGKRRLPPLTDEEIDIAIATGVFPE